MAYVRVHVPSHVTTFVAARVAAHVAAYVAAYSEPCRGTCSIAAQVATFNDARRGACSGTCSGSCIGACTGICTGECSETYSSFRNGTTAYGGARVPVGSSVYSDTSIDTNKTAQVATLAKAHVPAHVAAYVAAYVTTRPYLFHMTRRGIHATDVQSRDMSEGARGAGGATIPAGPASGGLTVTQRRYCDNVLRALRVGWGTYHTS